MVRSFRNERGHLPLIVDIMVRLGWSHWSIITKASGSDGGHKGLCRLGVGRLVLGGRWLRADLPGKVVDDFLRASVTAFWSDLGRHWDLGPPRMTSVTGWLRRSFWGRVEPQHPSRSHPPSLSPM